MNSGERMSREQRWTFPFALETDKLRSDSQLTVEGNKSNKKWISWKLETGEGVSHAAIGARLIWRSFRGTFPPTISTPFTYSLGKWGIRCPSVCFSPYFPSKPRAVRKWRGQGSNLIIRTFSVFFGHYALFLVATASPDHLCARRWYCNCTCSWPT